MAIPYEPLVEEDFHRGYGTVPVTMPGGGTATGRKVGLHTFFRGPVHNIKDFGGVVDGITDDSDALVRALAALPTTGGEIYIPAGECLLRSLTTLDVDYVTISGAGPGLTTLHCTSTTGGIKVEADYCTLKDFGVYYTGTGAYGIKFYNGTAHPSTGVFAPRMENVKIKGGTGTSHGLWLVNTLRGSFRDLYAPCGGGDAIRLESSGFHTFVDPKITINNGEDSPKWANGLTLRLQSGNTTFQSDDNKFLNLLVEGTSGYGVLITDLLGTIAPARNGFHGGTSESNVSGDVALDNSQNNSFYDFHTESVGPAKNFWIVGNTGNHGNKFVNCVGNLDIDDPPVVQGIQATSIIGHLSDVTIAGDHVFGTHILGMAGTLVDAGSQTRAYRSTLATSPNAVTQDYYAGRYYGPPTASVQSIQGSGGVFAQLVDLPDGMAGKVTVTSTQDGSNKIAIYEIGFSNGSAGASIGTPVTLATFGATTAQLTFQLTGTVLEAKGANATAPDEVKATVDAWTL